MHRLRNFSEKASDARLCTILAHALSLPKRALARIFLHSIHHLSAIRYLRECKRLQAKARKQALALSLSF